jgi:hypothetical protein
MVDNCSKRKSNREIDDWMVRTEVKISMKKKYYDVKCAKKVHQLLFHVQIVKQVIYFLPLKKK